MPYIGTISVPIETTITAASSPNVNVSLTLNAGRLLLHAQLHNLLADYSSTASGQGGFSSTGTVSYQQISIDGELHFDGDTATLIDGQVTSASQPVVEDSGGMPAAAVSAVIASMDDEIKAAIVEATAAASGRIATDLMQQLRPDFGADFDPPVDQDSRVQQSQVQTNGLRLDYSTKITATSPLVAAATDGVLRRSVSANLSAGQDLRALLGSPLVNQLVFAAWDAGNFEQVSLDPQTLHEGGMPALSFPYSLLSGVDIKLLLSPLLEWDSDGAWLDLGGIEVVIHVDGVEDTQAWTSARVPVQLVASADKHSLKLISDNSRASLLRAVEIAGINPFAQIDEVNSLISAAVPAVVATVFDQVPAMRLPAFTVKKLDNSDGPRLQVELDDSSGHSVDMLGDAWLLHLQLSRVQ